MPADRFYRIEDNDKLGRFWLKGETPGCCDEGHPGKQ